MNYRSASSIKKGKYESYEVFGEDGNLYVVKPKQGFGKINNTNISRSTQYIREAAAYKLDNILGFNIVPETDIVWFDGLPASKQNWVEGVTSLDIVGKFKLSIEDGFEDQIKKFKSIVNEEQLRKMVLLDLITNNKDRHVNNCLFDLKNNKVWAIDNGQTFGRYFDKYFNVFHRSVFLNSFILTKDERVNLEKITMSTLDSALINILSRRQIEETYWRAQWILQYKDIGYFCVAPTYWKEDFPNKAEWISECRGVKPDKDIEFNEWEPD